MGAADEQIEILEKTIQARVKLRPPFRYLKTVPGIGQTLALTIMLETGEIRRFASVGNYASYCRCVGTKRISNGKRKGSGNTKNGNKYLAWAFVDAANFAIRFSPRIKSFYQKKKSKSNRLWPSKRWRTSCTGPVTTSSRIGSRSMSPGHLPDEGV